MNAVTLLEDALAAYRVTRLVVEDTILDTPRGAALAWLDGAHPKLGEGLRCYWCVGFWVGLSVAAAARYAPRYWRPAARALTIMTIAGALGDRM